MGIILYINYPMFKDIFILTDMINRDQSWPCGDFVILNKYFVFVLFFVFSLCSTAAEVRSPVVKTMVVNVNNETLGTGPSSNMEIYIPEIQDYLQGSHQGGRFSTAYFSNAKSIVNMLLHEAIKSNNCLEAKVEIQSELRRVYDYQCHCHGSNCPFRHGQECKPTDKFSEYIWENVTIDILGFKFSSEENLPIESDQL